MKRLALVGMTAAFMLSGSMAMAQSTLRIGLAEDPDILDPTLARTYVGRIVFAAICDKLFDIDDKLNIVPQLALSHETSEDRRRAHGLTHRTQPPAAVRQHLALCLLLRLHPAEIGDAAADVAH